MARDSAVRIIAGLIAAATLAAMIPPIIKNAGLHDGVLGAIWWLLRFFTILTNLAIGVAFAAIAWRGREAVAPLVQGGLMLAIVMVGLVFNLLLPPLSHATWLDALADHVHHVGVPVAVILWWIVFAPHGRLSWRVPLVWAGYPLAYAVYILGRAQLEPTDTPARYPYFFIDVVALGWPTVLVNMVGLAAVFVAAGYLAVWIDRRIG